MADHWEDRSGLRPVPNPRDTQDPGRQWEVCGYDGMYTTATGPKPEPSEVLVPESDLQALRGRVEELLAEMKAAGFPHEDCESCAELRVAVDRTRAALSGEEE